MPHAVHILVGSASDELRARGRLAIEGWETDTIAPSAIEIRTRIEQGAAR